MSSSYLLLSIIVPTSNSEKYILSFLANIRLQSFSNYELIIIDNASTDNTVNIIKKFSDKVSIDIISEKDKGIYDAMNKGVHYAKGEWLYFMGADDQLANESVLESLMPFLNDENDIVYGDSVWLPGNNKEAGEWGYEKLLNQSINHQRIFYRKTLFDKYGGYDIRYKVAADHELNIRFFCNPSIRKKYIPVTIALYHSGGFSANKMDIVFWENWDNTIRKPFSSLLPKKKIYGSLGTYIRHLVKQKNYARAFQLMAKHFYNTRSLGFQRLMLNHLIKMKKNYAG